MEATVGEKNFVIHLPEGYVYDPDEIVDRKQIGNITKVVFANGFIKYFMFDSQVGYSEVPGKEGVQAERVFEEKQKAQRLRALAEASFNRLH